MGLYPVKNKIAPKALWYSYKNHKESLNTVALSVIPDIALYVWGLIIKKISVHLSENYKMENKIYFSVKTVCRLNKFKIK